MVCQYLVIFLGTLFLVERNIGVVYKNAKAANIKRAPIFPGLQYLDHHYKTKCETSMDAPLKNFNSIKFNRPLFTLSLLCLLSGKTWQINICHDCETKCAFSRKETL